MGERSCRAKLTHEAALNPSNQLYIGLVGPKRHISMWRLLCGESPVALRLLRSQGCGGDHCVTGGLDCFEDFAAEAEGEAFVATLRRTYPHLAEGGAP
jgi:hypothetical protein